MVLRLSVARDRRRKHLSEQDNDEEVVLPIEFPYLLGELTVSDVPQSVANFVFSEESRRANEEAFIASGYRPLGERIYVLVATVANQVINYARTVKGQYWLHPFDVDPTGMQQQFYRWETRAWIDGKAFHWSPTSIGRVIALFGSHLDRFLTPTDWTKLGDVVRERTAVGLESVFPLPLELVAVAEGHLDAGDPRAALVMAVSGLEAAIDRAIRLDSARWKASFFENGADKLRGKLALRGTLVYLLPLIYSTNEIPADLLRRVVRAVDARNRIIHAQGSLGDSEGRPFVNAIRLMIRRLWELEPSP